tara:strand:+ start:316 stop:597 length:282 start_codon:yes stop_codon:yes gene_type:complete
MTEYILNEYILIAENSINIAPDCGSVRIMDEILKSLKIIVNERKTPTTKKDLRILRYNIENVFTGRFITPKTQKVQENVIVAVAMAQDYIHTI